MQHQWEALIQSSVEGLLLDVAALTSYFRSEECLHWLKRSNRQLVIFELLHIPSLPCVGGNRKRSERLVVEVKDS